MPLLFALLAFVGWGSGDIFGGIVTRKIGGYSAVFWANVVTFVLSTLYVPFALNQLHLVTLPTLLVGLVLAPIGIIPLTLLYKGLSLGNASLVGTIGGSFAAVIVILSIIFLGDKVTPPEVGAILIIFVGLICSSLDFSHFSIKQLLTDKGVPYAFGAMLVWGIYFTFIRIPIRQFGWFWPSYFSILSFPLLYVFMKFKHIKLELPPSTKMLGASVANAALLNIGSIGYNFAIAKGETAIVAPIAGSYPVLFAVLAYFVFKDRLKKQQVLGIVITLAGIVLLSILNV